jgi:FG-GAP-like repeat
MRAMIRPTRLRVLGTLFGLSLGVAASNENEHVLREFRKFHLTPIYWSEGANFGDFNRDGIVDVVCGPHIYLGPDYKFRHEFYPAVAPTKRGPNDMQIYALDNFFSFVYDFNADGWADILTIGLPSTAAYWYENPKLRFSGPPGPPVHWKRHDVIDQVNNESPDFGDITGDGRPELIMGYRDRLGYATPHPTDPAKPWTFHAISAEKTLPHHYTHGLGYGDVDADGRADFLSKDGWWSQPPSLAGDPEWKFHAFQFTERGGAQMFTYDVNGDGRNDVITSLNAHAWGLSWFEQIRATDGGIGFKEHVLMSKGEENLDNPYGVQFSELHAVALVDVDGDGLKDILTGKCYRSHDFADPGSRQPPVIYYFRLTRRDGNVEYVPHRIDDQSGVGRQLATGDLNGDGMLDFVIGNKNGTFVFLQQVRKVSATEWDQSQPKRVR